MTQLYIDECKIREGYFACVKSFGLETRAKPSLAQFQHLGVRQRNLFGK